VISLDGPEAEFFAGARWVTLAELEIWPDLLAPRRFAELLAPVLVGLIPAEPVDAGV
jgi:hypothetical protein